MQGARNIFKNKPKIDFAPNNFTHIVGRPKLASQKRRIVNENRRNSKVICQMKVQSSQKREEKRLKIAIKLKYYN